MLVRQRTQVQEVLPSRVRTPQTAACLTTSHQAKITKLEIYYIDASIPKAVRMALAGVRSDVLYAGGPNAPVEDTLDDVWLPMAGAGDWIVIHRDKRIRYKPIERRALIDNGVRAFCLTGAGHYTRWETLRLIAGRWDDIERIASTQPGPYIYSVTSGGISRSSPPQASAGLAGPAPDQPSARPVRRARVARRDRPASVRESLTPGRAGSRCARPCRVQVSAGPWGHSTPDHDLASGCPWGVALPTREGVRHQS